MRWGLARSSCWAFALALLMITVAEAAGEKSAKPSEFIFIVQIVLLIAVGRGLGEIMQRIGQPSVIGELLGGLLLGPSLFGWLWPEAQGAIFPSAPEQKAMIEGVAQFGILLLLLLTGMETDLKLVRRVGRAAITISIAGIVVPFICGFALGQFLPENLLPHPEARLVASLFLGTALSISSVKIVAVVVREMNFMRRNVGQIIVATAVIDDTIGWIIIAIIFSLASRGSLDIFSVGQAVLGTLVFLAVSFTIGRRLVFQLIRWANDHLVSSAAVITVILLLMSGMALITHLIGVHTVLGAFVAGVLVGESPILTRQIDERLRGLITSLFMPVFFGLAGLERRPHDPERPEPAAADRRAGADREPRKIRRRVRRRQPRRAEPQGILCARQRHECAGIDRGHHRDHRPVDGGAEPEPVLDDRDHGDPDHDGDAADAARGA